MAELVGIILGDGNIHIYKGKKSTSYMVRIAGDSIKEKEYLVNHVKPLCEDLFGLTCKTYQHKTHNELIISINSKKVVEFLLSIGLKNGNKIKSQVSIPRWIVANNSFLKACLKGLIDTDGSIYELKPHWPGLWQICFTNKSEQILSDFSKGLAQLDIKCSNTYRYKSGIKTPKIYITKKSELSKFYKEIGFSNPKHQNKLQPRGVVD